MNIHFWGSTDDVTGSMTFIDLPGGKIIIDCGLTQGTDEIEKLNSLKLPYEPREIKAVLLTHAHLDHSGYLPRLVKKGFRGNIFCTPSTAKLARIILLDSAKLNEDEFYDEKDVQQTLHLIKTYEWNHKFELLGAQVHFISAGHILGASSVVINSKGQKIVFSGDLGRFDDPILLPHSPCPEADIIVMESTYGGKIREKDIEKELHSFLMTVSRGNKVGIVASFAVARAQTLLTLIQEFFERHPEDKVRVVIDSPMMTEANKVYQQYAHLTKHRENLYTALAKIDSIDFQKEWESLRKKEGPLVIISSSGMLTGGRISRHLYNWHDDDKAILFLPGYQGKGTPGRRILEGERSLLGPKGEPFVWQGEVWNSEAFSSHADQQELIRWVTENNKTSKVFLLHGEQTSKEALKDKLRGMDVTIPLRDMRITLD
jgi:metallo-beta-lactamase family protein